jgi:hypothetical protein
MIAGSFASTTHGVPRTTQDLDLVIDPPDLAALDALVASMPVDAYYVDAAGGSERQRRDVAGILAAVGQGLDRQYIERWVLDLDLVDEWRKAQATAS